MALRKSKSYNAITISTTRRTVWRESFVGFYWRPRKTTRSEARENHRCSADGRNIESVSWSIYFYHFIQRNRLFLSASSALSLSPRHDDDDDVVMWTYLQWAFSHAKLSSLALVVIGELMRWDWKFFARVWLEEWGRTWNKRFIPKLAKFPATSQFVVSQSFISNSNSRPRVSTIKREFRSAS